MRVPLVSHARVRRVCSSRILFVMFLSVLTVSLPFMMFLYTLAASLSEPFAAVTLADSALSCLSVPHSPSPSVTSMAELLSVAIRGAVGAVGSGSDTTSSLPTQSSCSSARLISVTLFIIISLQFKFSLWGTCTPFCCRQLLRPCVYLHY